MKIRLLFWERQWNSTNFRFFFSSNMVRFRNKNRTKTEPGAILLSYPFSTGSSNSHRTPTEPPIERSGKVHWQPFRTFGRTGSGPVSLQVRKHNICDSHRTFKRSSDAPRVASIPPVYTTTLYPLPPTEKTSDLSFSPHIEHTEKKKLQNFKLFFFQIFQYFILFINVL